MIGAGFDPTLFFTLVAALVTGFLGFIVYFHDHHSVTNIIFFVHSLIGMLWALVNYVSLVVLPPQALFWIRGVIVLAVFHVFLFFLFVKNFSNSNTATRGYRLWSTIFLMTLTAALAGSPYVFKNITIIGGKAFPVPGSLMPLFAIILVVFFLVTVFLVIKRYFKEQDTVIKRQWFSIGTGLVIAYSLLIFLVFLRVILFEDTSFVPYSPLFVLPIFIGAAYAILRHHLFNVRVIATELVIFFLILVLLIQFINAQSALQSLVNGIVLVSTLALGLFLIKGVLKEVKQREQIGTLNVQLQRSIEELRKVDELKTEFVSLASHQLRTPLTAIKGYVDMLRSGDFGALNGEQKEVSEKVFASSQRMVDLIDDLLDVSKLEKEGGFSYQFQVGNPEEVFKAVVEEFQKPAREKGLTLSFSSRTSPDLSVKFDPEKLKEAISNIVSNSLKYTIEGGVSISLTESTDMIVLTIRDTGVGIDADDIPKIFQKFFRAKAVARLTTEGTGLGLYFTRAVIEDHGGHVWVESDGVGKGSTFIVKLPKVDETVKPPAEEEIKSEVTEASKGSQVTANVKVAEQKKEAMRRAF